MYDDFNDIEIFARTIYGEARGEGLAGMAAVACVIMNRVNTDLGNDGKPDWWGEGVRDVCLKPWQFSCWNSNDPNLPILTAKEILGQVYQSAMVLARLAMEGLLTDKTLGATHYFDVRMDHTKIPKWAEDKKPLTVIGHHAFYLVA